MVKPCERHLYLKEFKVSRNLPIVFKSSGYLEMDLKIISNALETDRKDRGLYHWESQARLAKFPKKRPDGMVEVVYEIGANI